jgi:hypothetical protein
MDVFDFSLEEQERIQLFLNAEDYVKDDVVSRIEGIYMFSGSILLQHFICSLCKLTTISFTLKLNLALSLFSFEEFEEPVPDVSDLKEIIEQGNKEKKDRNTKRKETAYATLNTVLSMASLNDPDFSTTRFIDTIYILTESELYKKECNTYFKDIVGCSSYDFKFRYNTILSLDSKVNVNKDYFKRNALLHFFNCLPKTTMYKILTAQLILMTLPPEDPEFNRIQEALLEMAEDKEVDYNLKADCLDTLHNLGKEPYISNAKKLIYILGKTKYSQSMFDNAQNVHFSSIEDSVIVILQYLFTFKNMTIEGEEADFFYVNNEINKLLLDESLQCNRELVKCSLERISVDRSIYSKFNTTISNVLVKVWSYIHSRETCREELIKRLLEELEDMAGTCSSGFISRLVNTLSGYDDFTLKISWEDQIISNVTARLNYYAKHLLSEDYGIITLIPEEQYLDFLDQIILIWLNKEVNQALKNNLIEIYKTESEGKKHDQHNADDILKLFRRCGNLEEEVYFREFKDCVISELTELSSDYSNRKNFSLFFRTVIPYIRMELYEEFKDYITDADFGLLFKKAIVFYEA